MKVEELVDDAIFHIEEGTRLGTGGKWPEELAGEKSVFVAESERLEIDQRDLLICESAGESISPNIN